MRFPVNEPATFTTSHFPSKAMHSALFYGKPLDSKCMKFLLYIEKQAQLRRPPLLLQQGHRKTHECYLKTWRFLWFIWKLWPGELFSFFQGHKLLCQNTDVKNLKKKNFSLFKNSLFLTQILLEMCSCFCLRTECMGWLPLRGRWVSVIRSDVCHKPRAGNKRQGVRSLKHLDEGLCKVYGKRV